MIIKTLSDAVTIVEFLISHQGKSINDAIAEAEIPLHLRDQVVKYFSPPLEIISPDLIVNNVLQIPKCNPDADSNQQYFGAFRRFLIDKKLWQKSTVGSLEETSLDLIRRMPRPDAASKFQTMGLVIGYIQSGKTANMEALIARAADEGYKLFIILSGFWKDLRSQTQRRFDQEITGRSDFQTEGPFVEHDAGVSKWVRLTGSGLEGDFVPGPNDSNPLTPKLAVIKKNKRIEKLCQWLKKSPVSLDKLPAIIIDDEADQGSIDTNYGRRDDDGERIDPTATNRRIRELLKLLPKCVYVGYTATPFANVLIDATAEDDLYPRDFIATLPEPPGYFGPRKLFGLGMEPSDLSSDEPEKPPIDLIRYIEEEALDALDKVIKEGGDCPAALSDAILAFTLSSCARLARGHNKNNDHFSMLVHTSQRTEPHRIFAEAINKELELLRNAAARPKMFPEVIRRAQKLWDSDFCKVTAEQNDAELGKYNFETIWKFAKSLTESIEVKVINSNSEDILDYTGHPKRYIVVGGNRLSRGLTLEGLSVSLFTRATNQYDTLLQMGRWFGYRPNYYDLTRIYVDRPIAERFAELARVEDELRADLRKYAQKPDPPTPLQLKPVIRSHPTMLVTSRMKMGAARKINVSFQNTIQQTVAFPFEKRDLLIKNIESAHSLISSLKTQQALGDAMHIWKDLPSPFILDFLNSYEFSRDAWDVNRQNLVNYISRQNKKGELVLWDLVLPRGNPKCDPHVWSKNILTHKIIRLPMTTSSIKVLSSPSDINGWRQRAGRDAEDASRGCMMMYLIDKKSGLEGETKFFTSLSAAEDILGLVFIFPESKSNETIEYISQ